VDEVVGDLDLLRGAREAAGVGGVTDVQLGAGRLQRAGPGAVADQAPDRRARLDQRSGQPATDETGRAGYESPDPDPPQLPRLRALELPPGWTFVGISWVTRALR
jgi:hypothetical protein